jgi:hypothetical protein
MKEIDLNIENKISKNCQVISQFGSRLGTQFYKAEGRDVWQNGKVGFEADKAAIANGEKAGFILNRSPRKYLVKSHRIVGTQIVKDEITNEVVILINPDGNGGYDLSLPITSDLIKTGVVTQDTVSKALKPGGEEQFFMNADGLAKILNHANETEVRCLTQLRNDIDKMIQNIQSGIADNKQKAEAATKEWTDSAITPDLSSIVKGNATGVIVTESAE